MQFGFETSVAVVAKAVSTSYTSEAASVNQVEYEDARQIRKKL